MIPEITLETLAKDITDLKTLAAGIKVGQEEDEKKKMEAKKAMDEEHKKEEKKEAKHAKYNSAIKKAMEEDDHEKKEAMVKRAMEELHDEEHKADHENHDKNMDKHEAKDEKEKDAQIASIINDKKNSLIAQILTANRLINPNGLADVEARLKKASITKVQEEYNIVKPFISGVEQTTVTTPQQPVIPFYANISPADIDENSLTAASPDSDFAKLSTKELLEENQ